MVGRAVEVGNVEDVGMELEKWSGVSMRIGTITGGAGSEKWGWWWRTGDEVTFWKKDSGEIIGPGECMKDAKLRLE